MAAQQESVQPVSPGLTTLTKIKEWLTLASVIVVVVGGMAGGLLGGMKLVIAPLHADIRAIHGRMDRMDGRMQQMEKGMANEFKAVHSDLADIRERLTRVATLLERQTDQPGETMPRE
jgi:hypothetical protein